MRHLQNQMTTTTHYCLHKTFTNDQPLQPPALRPSTIDQELYFLTCCSHVLGLRLLSYTPNYPTGEREEIEKNYIKGIEDNVSLFVFRAQGRSSNWSYKATLMYSKSSLTLAQGW